MSEKDSGLSLLPTPVKSDASIASLITKEMRFHVTKNGTWRKISNSGQDGSVGLTRTLKLPTPKHSDRLTAGVKACKPGQQQHLSSTVREVLTISKTDNRLLSAEFVEQIMGFPMGWTDLEIENTDLPPPHLVTLEELPAIIDRGLTEDKPGLRTRLGQLGNSIVPQVGAIAFEFLTKILEEKETMLTLQELELNLTNLKADLKKASTKAKKEALAKQIMKLNRSLEAMSAYAAINLQDTVINGDPTKLGIVTAKEIQNNLPVVWVNWNGHSTSSVPNTLTVIPPKQLDWHWIENDFTRLYDRAPCDDIATLLEELERLKTEQKVLASAAAKPETETDTSSCLSNLGSLVLQNKNRQEKIIELWENAIAFHYPLDSGFFLHNRKVTVRSYQLCKQHNLVFPVVFDGQCEHLAHPLELRKIPLGLLTKVAHGGNPQDRTFAQINIFPEENADPDEPEEDKSDNLVIDPEFKNLLRPLTPEEYEQLEKNLIQDRDFVAITIWKGHNTIIDGHHSYAIAQKHDIPYTIKEVELPTRSAVVQWMYNLQLGRRNLSEAEKSYYRAKQYESLKQERGGDRNKERKNQYTVLNNNSRSKGHSDPLTKSTETSLNTADIVAKKTGVSEKTVKRDSKYAKAVDEVAAKLNISPQEIIHSDLSKKAISELKDQPVEVIRKKLANPKAKPKRNLPQLKVGQLVQIRSDRTNKDLVGYNKSYAVVKKLKRNCADIDVWGKLLTDIHLQFLSPIEEGKVAICANVSPQFLIRIMENYTDFDQAVEHIPVAL